MPPMAIFVKNAFIMVSNSATHHLARGVAVTVRADILLVKQENDKMAESIVIVLDE